MLWEVSPQSSSQVGLPVARSAPLQSPGNPLIHPPKSRQANISAGFKQGTTSVFKTSLVPEVAKTIQANGKAEGEAPISNRNPAWQRDELILALDLYFRHNPSYITKTHPEVVKLSDILNVLPIHTERPDEEKFRNPNGVYMKLCNFLRFDPSYKGSGLTSGGKLEEVIWNEFASDLSRLKKTAEAIRQGVTGQATTKTIALPVDDEEEFPEGKLLYRMHRMRERDRSLAEKAKAKRLQEMGKLACDVCNFDFSEVYGELGSGYIECHHTKPVSELGESGTTKVKDLAMVCANCHRMLHRRRPWLSLAELQFLTAQHMSSR